MTRTLVGLACPKARHLNLSATGKPPVLVLGDSLADIIYMGIDVHQTLLTGVRQFIKLRHRHAQTHHASKRDCSQFGSISASGTSKTRIFTLPGVCLGPKKDLITQRRAGLPIQATMCQAATAHPWLEFILCGPWYLCGGASKQGITAMCGFLFGSLSYKVKGVQYPDVGHGRGFFRNPYSV